MNTNNHAFAMIYRLKVELGQEKTYAALWATVAQFMKEQRGALGSCLHQDDNGDFIVYSQWPDQTTHDAAWPGADADLSDFPTAIQDATAHMRSITIERFDDMRLTVCGDLLTNTATD